MKLHARTATCLSQCASYKPGTSRLGVLQGLCLRVPGQDAESAGCGLHNRDHTRCKAQSGGLSPAQRSSHSRRWPLPNSAHCHPARLQTYVEACPSPLLAAEERRTGRLVLCTRCALHTARQAAAQCWPLGLSVRPPWLPPRGEFAGWRAWRAAWGSAPASQPPCSSARRPHCLLSVQGDHAPHQHRAAPGGAAASAAPERVPLARGLPEGSLRLFRT